MDFSERFQQMEILHNQGQNYAQIGRAFNLTGERIRQIFMENYSSYRKQFKKQFKLHRNYIRAIRESDNYSIVMWNGKEKIVRIKGGDALWRT